MNEGFFPMTGYTKDFAMYKTPKILQGKNTLDITKERIQLNLSKNKPFKEVILNYKKDGTPYECEVHIFPLQNRKKTTHFLALEKDISLSFLSKVSSMLNLPIW